MIRFACARCQKQFKAHSGAAGKSTSCPKCGEPLTIPFPSNRLDNLSATAHPFTVTQPHDPPNKSESHQQEDHWAEARIEIIDFDAVKAEFNAIRWSQLNPLIPLFRDGLLSLVWVQFLTFAFCFPLILAISYREDASLEEAAWALSLYFAILWAVFLHRCVQPDRLRKRAILGVWCGTAFLGVLAVVMVTEIGQFVPVLRNVFAATASESYLVKLVSLTLSVGCVEEIAKAIPVLWVAYRLKPGFRLTTPMYLGAVSGLAFGATEGLLYSVRYATAHNQFQFSYGSYLVIQVLRFVSLPLLHAVWCATFGYFIGLSASHRSGALGTLVIGLGLVAVLHGAFDTFADSWGGFAIACLSLALFVCYVRLAQCTNPPSQFEIQ